MMTRSFRRTTILLLLVAVCATPCVRAAGPRTAESARPAQALAPAGLVFLDQLWSTLRNLWSKSGCQIDPSGLCLSSPAPQPPPTIETDEGCNIDPSGRCRP
jgi:hypothetical protein